ncbi:MAG: response regulator [Alphaproteobacteria bacterium]|nr:response regulator [Alphaproteobacteria bacterium]MBU0859648.1 response regulator [Alphaproteobacteria bacterium]
MALFEKKPQPYDLSNFTILIVEDSLYMQTLMASMLKAFGVGDILACENGKEAIDLLKVLQASKKSRHLRNIDIVLTDWLMPNGSGQDLLRWIRSHDKDSVRFLPVIVVSGYTTEYITTAARDLGAHETLVKPVSGTSLASRICSVIDHPRPFIDAPEYFGPDRRRHDIPFRGMDRRIIAAEQIKVKHASAE